MENILVTGATGFLGKHVVYKLKAKGIEPIVTSLSLGVDLRNYDQTITYFKLHRPTIILNCAAFVGGIQFGYKYPVELWENNLLININLLKCAKEIGVQRIVNPISNCVYPAKASLLKESEIWDGPMHDSVLSYAFSRKAFWVGAWAYQKQHGLQTNNIVLPNMYGPGDHFEEERSHALGALIMKFVEAERFNEPFVNVWGSGTPVREWLHIEDGAEAILRAMSVNIGSEMINIGIGLGITVLKMAELIKELTGYRGTIKLDETKPDGAPYKVMEASNCQNLLNWSPSLSFKKGVEDTIHWYKTHHSTTSAA